MEALLLTLVGWLHLNTDYDMRFDMPNVVMTESGNMCDRYGIKDGGTCRATRLKGFYDKHLTIYLPAGFDPDNPDDQSRLLHELVHYVQYYNNVNTQECWAQLEVEAYRLQDEWRTEHNLQAKADPFKMVMLEAACET